MRKYLYIYKSEMMSSLQYITNIMINFLNYFIHFLIFFYLWNYIYNNPDEKNSVQKIKKRLTEYKISAKINNILRVCLSKFCERHRVKWILPTLE